MAMGRSSDLLARLLKVFVKQPIPKVAFIANSELHMAISAALCGLAGAPLSQFRAMSPKNTAVTLLESRGGVLQVVAQNIRAHLQTG